MSEVCPICLSIDGFPVRRSNNTGYDYICDCPNCGTYIIDIAVIDDNLADDRVKTTPAARASLSHWVSRQPRAINTTRVTEDVVIAAIERRLPLPNPAQLATNILRYIGEATLDTGEPLIALPQDFRAKVGAINLRSAFQILHELVGRRLVTASFPPDANGQSVQELELTLDGWTAFETERVGKTAGSYGFLALKFNDEILDRFVQAHVKPAITELGYELRTMQDTARSGIIDNLMRIDIRDSAFVIADLTHDNPGAYWEAGYAEGLGKPVLYICEKSKFVASKTHFDTSHSTTVQWDADDPGAFKREIIATLRRSLVL